MSRGYFSFNGGYTISAHISVVLLFKITDLSIALWLYYSWSFFPLTPFDPRVLCTRFQVERCIKTKKKKKLKNHEGFSSSIWTGDKEKGDLLHSKFF